MPPEWNQSVSENSEGSTGLANAVLRHLADKLPSHGCSATHRFDGIAQHGRGVRLQPARLRCVPARPAQAGGGSPGNFTADLDACWESHGEPVTNGDAPPWWQILTSS